MCFPILLDSAYRHFHMRTESSAYRPTHANFNSAYRNYHRRASARLTETITGEPELGLQKLISGEPELGLQTHSCEFQFGLQKLRYRGKMQRNPSRRATQPAAAPQTLRCPYLRQGPYVKIFSNLVCIRDLNDPSGGGRRSWRRLHFDS